LSTALDRAEPQNARATSIVVGALWIVWAILLFGGTLLSESPVAADAQARDSILLIAHLGSSCVLVMAAWLWRLGNSRSAASGTIALIALGMTLGAVGDFFNANLLQSWVKLPDPVLGGIAAFALGHLAYITACLKSARRFGFRSATRRWIAIGFWQAVGLAGWYFVVYRGTNVSARGLVWPALPYSLLLAGTAGLATYLALEDRHFFSLAAGAALFLISDLVLAFRLFHGEFPMATHAVWLTYGPGQMLIVYSIGALSRAVRSTPNVTDLTNPQAP
jgi:uncharacterized membrane protein YhhN